MNKPNRKKSFRLNNTILFLFYFIGIWGMEYNILTWLKYIVIGYLLW